MLCRFPTLCYTSLQVLMTFYASKWTLSPSCCILETLFFPLKKGVFTSAQYDLSIPLPRTHPSLSMHPICELFIFISLSPHVISSIFWNDFVNLIAVYSVSSIWWMLYIHNPQKNEPVLHEPVISMHYSPNLRKSIISSEVNWAPSFCFATVLFCQSN